MVNDQPYIIDFQYAKFLEQPSPQSLVGQAARLVMSIQSNNDWLDKQNVEHWFIQLCKALSLEPTPLIKDIFWFSTKNKISSMIRFKAGLVTDNQYLTALYAGK